MNGEVNYPLILRPALAGLRGASLVIYVKLFKEEYEVITVLREIDPISRKEEGNS